MERGRYKMRKNQWKIGMIHSNDISFHWLLTNKKLQPTSWHIPSFVRYVLPPLYPRYVPYTHILYDANRWPDARMSSIHTHTKLTYVLSILSTLTPRYTQMLRFRRTILDNRVQWLYNELPSLLHASKSEWLLRWCNQQFRSLLLFHF